MEEGQPQNDNTITTKEGNAASNIGVQDGPENREDTSVSSDQTNFNSIHQTFLTRFDRQDEMTHGTNDKLDALASAQTVLRDQLDNIHQRSANESSQPRRSSSFTIHQQTSGAAEHPGQTGPPNDDRLNRQPSRTAADAPHDSPASGPNQRMGFRDGKNEIQTPRYEL